MKLSVIMPVYNVEKTFSIALDSVLMQDVDFDYEIIIVDDGSTDSTPQIIKEYSKKYPQIKLITNDHNKGLASAFYDALCASKGDYYCVLDGDDYYTVRSKLKRQVDFLDSDKEEMYAAVAHKYFLLNEDGLICNEPILFSNVTEYSYHHFLRGIFYYHTSAYMYRNTFRGNVPQCFKLPLYEGDTPRTFLHLSKTKGKVKVLNFVGSVYRYNGEGIWSKLSFQERAQANIDMYSAFREKLETEEEKKIIEEGSIAKYEKINNKRRHNKKI